MNQVIIICGLTASGKTDLAVSLARQYHGEIISVDARQAYRYMDIGTGKDLLPNSRYVLIETINNNSHPYQYGYYTYDSTRIWLYDVATPDQPMHVGLFFSLTWKAIQDCWHRQVLPIVVGGDGFYLKNIFNPPETLLTPPDPILRDKLASLSLSELQSRLKEIDIAKWTAMNHSDQSNPRRLIRAIEVGNTQVGKITTPPADVRWYGINLDNNLLTDRIKQRVEKRINAGFADEFLFLQNKYPEFNQLPGGKTIGYQQWPDKQAWIQAEISYAKRQKTWFKKQPHISWLQSSGKSISQILF